MQQEQQSLRESSCPTVAFAARPKRSQQARLSCFECRGNGVPDSVRDPLSYYFNNTCKSRTLIACAIKAKLKHFIFSSSAAVYGVASETAVTEEAELRPISPYGSSKLMTEIMLRDRRSHFRWISGSRPKRSDRPIHAKRQPLNQKLR